MGREQPMKTLGWSLGSAGLALLIAFAAILFETGIIVDESGGVGSLLVTLAACGIAGGALLVLGVVALAVAFKRHSTRSTRS
jgi:hypothetical protein